MKTTTTTPTPRTDNRWDIYSNLAKGLKAKKTPLAPAALGSAFLLGLPMTGMAQTYCYQSVNTTIANNDDYLFDMDGNGNTEMTLRVRTGGTAGSFIDLFLNKQYIEKFFFNTSYFAYPAVVGTGVTITTAQMNFGVNSNFNSINFTRNGNNGNWLNTGGTPVSGYTVFQFEDKAGNSHLAWIYLTVTSANNPPASVVIRDYAVNTIPVGMTDGNSIVTGDGIGSGVACASVLPVELTRFEAVAQKENIQLLWRTETETNNAGFEVQRSENGKDFKTLEFIEGAGTTVEPQEYAFADQTARPGIECFYRLKQIDFDGAFEYSEIVTAGLKGDQLEVSEVFPNPTIDAAQINVTVPKGEQLTLELFDNTGKLLRSQQQQVGAGVQTLELDVNGLAAGLYFVKVQTAQTSAYRKIVIR